MIIADEIQIFNFEGAFRGLRNPLESWGKSDSFFGIVHKSEINDIIHSIADKYEKDEKNYMPKEQAIDFLYENGDHIWLPRSKNGDYRTVAFIGPKDLDLAQRMIKGGTDESKFMRQIFISMDINAPLYWWKEKDTYKIATVANSCSTMHRIDKTEIDTNCFSFDLEYNDPELNSIYKTIIEECEYLRNLYIKTKDKKYWRALIQILPEGWMQKRTWTGNYQNLTNEFFARKNHKLTEWQNLCKYIEAMPYGKSLICYKKGKE